MAFDTPVLVALVTAISGIIGGVVAKVLMGRKDSAALAMEIARQARDDVKELREEIAELREELNVERNRHDGTRKKRRIMEEKYSAAIEWIVVVQTNWESCKIQMDLVGAPFKEMPPIPQNIREDIYNPKT